VTRFFLALAAAFIGGLLGLGLTALSVETPPDFGVVRAGPWMTRPRIGTAQADPYSRALMAARGILPMGAAEGLMLTASRDSSGAVLAGACTYRISGPVPGGGFWTLSAYDGNGRTSHASDLRSGLTSDEALRFEGEALTIMLSPQAQPGNWIPVNSSGAFELILRLYDSQTSAHAIDASALPRITREGCP